MHHLIFLWSIVATDIPLLPSLWSAVSCSKGSSHSPVHCPDGQSEAARAEQLPAQLAPRPQVATSIVLFGWQQFTATDSLKKVKTLSKNSTEVAFVFSDNNIWVKEGVKKEPYVFSYQPGLLVFWQNGWLVDSDEHAAVSVGSPSQAAVEGALLQLRNLNFFPQEQVGSHSDHSPHSDQTAEASPSSVASEGIARETRRKAKMRRSLILIPRSPHMWSMAERHWALNDFLIVWSSFIFSWSRCRAINATSKSHFQFNYRVPLKTS